MQLGMPYSTAFNALPSTVDNAVLSMKKEFTSAAAGVKTETIIPMKTRFREEIEEKSVNFKSKLISPSKKMQVTFAGEVLCKSERRSDE